MTRPKTELAPGETMTRRELPGHLTCGTCFPRSLVPTSVQGLASFFPSSHSMILRKCPRLMNAKVCMTNRKCPLPDNFYFDRTQGLRPRAALWPAEGQASSAKARMYAATCVPRHGKWWLCMKPFSSVPVCGRSATPPGGGETEAHCS